MTEVPDDKCNQLADNGENNASDGAACCKRNGDQLNNIDTVLKLLNLPITL